jgi:phenylalanyl-tRNA synthetase alpha chain
MTLIAELERAAAGFTAALAGAASAAEAESLRNACLGRKGELTALMSRLPELPADERPAFGKAANAAKERLNRLLEERLATFRAQADDASLSRFDPSMPGRMPERGSLHPVTLMMEEICGILENLGFETVDGPEAETDFHNFEALNFPKDHPARDMQDTLFLGDGLLMRTHTSPMQVRAMLERKKPPVAVIAPGKVYRRDYDLTHSPMFHQVEGLLVDDGVSLAHLRGVLTHLLRELFGPDVTLRFRPSFFPFTEPSVEVDMSCVICRGSGRKADGKGGKDACRVCKGTGNLEILGAGMVDPAVFAAVGFDPACAGFAFGLGVERVAMLKYGIDDLRLFYENDLRFLGRFVK